MALVVASTSTATANSADSVVVTKPSGTTSGDLLLMVVSGLDIYNYATSTDYTSVIEYGYHASGAWVDASITMLYKVAGGSEPANYTVNLSGATSLGTVVLMRITGWTSGNPVYGYATAGNYIDAPSYTLSASGLSLSCPSSQLLVMGAMHRGDGNSATFSDYTVTSSGSNPTWTEVADQAFTVNNAIYGHCALAVAHANRSDTSDITGYSISAASSSAQSADASASFLAVILEPTSVSDSPALLSVGADQFSGSGPTNVNTTPALFSVAPNLFVQEGDGIVPSVWTTVTKS